MDSVQFDRPLPTSNHFANENPGYGPTVAGTGINDFSSRSSGTPDLCNCGRSDRVSCPKFELSQFSRIERCDGESRLESSRGCWPPYSNRGTERQNLCGVG